MQAPCIIVPSRMHRARKTTTVTMHRDIGKSAPSCSGLDRHEASRPPRVFSVDGSSVGTGSHSLKVERVANGMDDSHQHILPSVVERYQARPSPVLVAKGSYAS